ncbi:hypothetical protein C8J57DRAFT_1587815 [Mycena rebaudengoi]|nr:hypothetical protein C8J57DRAFT_1587815 [Mycena rebaudengoi]
MGSSLLFFVLAFLTILQYFEEAIWAGEEYIDEVNSMTDSAFNTYTTVYGSTLAAITPVQFFSEPAEDEITTDTFLNFSLARNRLSADSVRCLMCLGSWCKSNIVSTNILLKAITARPKRKVDELESSEADDQWHLVGRLQFDPRVRIPRCSENRGFEGYGVEGYGYGTTPSGPAGDPCSSLNEAERRQLCTRKVRREEKTRWWFQWSWLHPSCKRYLA